MTIKQLLLNKCFAIVIISQAKMLQIAYLYLESIFLIHLHENKTSLGGLCYFSDMKNSRNSLKLGWLLQLSNPKNKQAKVEAANRKGSINDRTSNENERVFLRSTLYRRACVKINATMDERLTNRYNWIKRIYIRTHSNAEEIEGYETDKFVAPPT